MEWSDLIRTRHTSFAWKDKTIPRYVLQEVLTEVYEHVPTKNLKFPYIITVYRNNVPEIRKEIATICHRNKDMSIEEDRGNPQVLAPVLFAFSLRDYKKEEQIWQQTYTMTAKNIDAYGRVEIGVVATFLMLALTNRGIQTGFCHNIGQGDDTGRPAEIFGTDYPVRLIIGAGYGKDAEGWHSYIDPRTGTERKIPFPPAKLDAVYDRPDFDKIFKFKGYENE